MVSGSAASVAKSLTKSMEALGDTGLSGSIDEGSCRKNFDGINILFIKLYFIFSRNIYNTELLLGRILFVQSSVPSSSC